MAGLVIDGWLQLAEIQSPLETYIDADLGPSYYPDRNFSRFNEGFFIGATNEWGFLGEGRPPHRADDELRVLLVGDSYVLGHTVFERQHFKNVLRDDLEAALGRPVAVLNFARADFHLWNMHRYYRDVVCRWDHDLALLFTNQADLHPRPKFGDDLYAVTTFDGVSLQADHSFRQSLMFRRSQLLAPIISRSAVVRLLFNTYKAANRGLLWRPLLDKLWPLFRPTPPRRLSRFWRPASAAGDQPGHPERTGGRPPGAHRLWRRDQARDPRQRRQHRPASLRSGAGLRRHAGRGDRPALLAPHRQARPLEPGRPCPHRAFPGPGDPGRGDPAVTRFLSILSFLVVGLATALVLDGWLQLAEIQTPLENRADPDLGPVYRPDVRFSRFSEGFFLGGANRWGFLGTGAPPERTDDTYRVLLLGDSFVLGHTVFERHHFKTVLARELGRRLGRPVEVLNFARADYCLWNMHQHYLDHASKWDHDLALFFLADGDLAPAYPADPQMYPYTELVDGDLRINRQFRDSAKRATYLRLEPVLTRLALPRMGFNLLKVVDTGQWRGMLLGKFAPRAASDAPAVALGEVPGPLPEDVRLAPAPPLPPVTPAVLRDLRDRGRCLAVLEWDIRPAWRDSVLASGLPTIDLGPLWRAEQAQGRDPWLWQVSGQHGHWNHEAHEVLGQHLAQELPAD